ncbi:complement factor H [Anableps anableps]
MIVRSCVLLLWLQFLTSVKCQDCTLEQFTNSPDFDSNFDISGLDATYTGGRQVRVPCNVGYSGFFKLICTEGKWKPTGSKCEPKSCGHPGDAQFADFRLEVGDDFVFGSRVVYECYRGYHMVSRTNRRRCLADGWDGNIPICEATKCPVIHVGNNVQMLGDAEEATSGNVVRFSCKSSDEILDGLQEIYCKDDGDWSGPAPKCKAIRCSIPQIEHGSVPSGPPEYKEHEVLNFRCDATYKRADERLPRCTKFAGKADWSPTPACKPIKCELTLPPITGTTYDPPYRNMFSPGETVRVTCGEKHWILDTQTTVADVTCKANGDWNTSPLCQEVTCPQYIREEYLYRPINAWRGNKLDDTVRYDCHYGYDAASPDRTATCTRDGWTPKPLCRGRGCAKPVIENSRITSRDKTTYNNGDQLTYECLRGNRDSFTITCDQGGWQGIQRCPGERPCLKPEIRNGFAVGPLEGSVYYSCNVNYKLPTKSWWGQAKCKDGVWDQIHPCIAKGLCGEAPAISNGKVTIKNTRAEIKCNEGYTPETPELTCLDGRWNFNDFTPKTICRATDEHCGPPPKVENGVITVLYRKEYLAGSSVTYQCREKYMLEEENTITCSAGKWETKNIKCVPECEKLSDSRLTVKVAMVKERYLEGDVIEYVCTAPGTNTEGNATCENGMWTKTEECPGIPCQVQELGRGLGISGFPPENNLVNPGNKLRFFCRDEFDLEGSEEIQCLETGKWDASFPTCSEKCIIPALPQTVRISSSVQGNVLSKGDKLSFSCRQSSHIMQGSRTSSCLENGKWSHPPPECEAAVNCPAPPALADGDTKSIISSNSVYQTGDRVEYICKNKYTMDGDPFKTCENGVWTGNMRCLQPCTVNEQIMNQHQIQFRYVSEKKLYAVHKEYITFSCKQWKTRVGRVPMRVQCNDGVMELPTCQ